MRNPDYKKITIIIEDETWRKTVTFNNALAEEIDLNYVYGTNKTPTAILDLKMALDDNGLYYIVKEEAL